VTFRRSEPPTRHEGRPRLWVPGVAYVTEAGDLHLGRSAGYSSQDVAFRRLRLGHRGRVASWTHVAWLMPRTALHPKLLDAHGVTLPEALIGRDEEPHAHRWLREQPLVCVSGDIWRRLADAGVCVYRVAFDATGARELDVEAVNTATGSASLTVALDALENARTASWNGLALVDVQGDPSPIDRALRVVTDGALDEASVLNAFDARCLVEDGYGYRGAENGRLVDLGRVTVACRPTDVLFGQIFHRARALRSLAEGLLGALSHAPSAAAEARVPVYDVARRLIVPPLHVTQVARLVIHGEVRRELDLPSERRWSLDRVEPWSPRLPSLAQRLHP
jgi:hypothetical protein